MNQDKFKKSIKEGKSCQVEVEHGNGNKTTYTYWNKQDFFRGVRKAK